MRRAVPLVLAVLVAGCGGDAQRPQPASPEAVVRGWADDLRRGDIEAAAGRFALPATVSNGTAPQELTTRSQIRGFHADLPCGGRVARIQQHAGVLVATIVLTERPGGDCGEGAGGTVRTAFEVRGGKIVGWLRLPDEDEDEDAPSGPLV